MTGLLFEEDFEVSTDDHKDVFKRIRNYLAGRVVGATRDRSLLDEVLRCVFCKNYISSNDIKIGHQQSSNEVLDIYKNIFALLKTEFSLVFSREEEITLDSESLYYVHNELSLIDFNNHQRDVFGDLYEIFISTGVREEEGQFFTPQNGVELLVSVINPQPHESILDPAAGAGGFLSASLKHLTNLGIDSKVASAQIYGIEKDSYLAKLTATRLALLSLTSVKAICGDSLAWTNEQKNPLTIVHGDNSFDIILTNPPFGKNIVATSKEVQATYELGYQWKIDESTDTFIKTKKLLNSVPPQVLFVEKCIKLLKAGGRMGIVLPESLLTSKQYSYVINYIRSHGTLKLIIGLPEDFFKTSGKGGTHTKACLVLFEKKANIETDKIFMAEAKWCGHDSRGKKINKDDLPIILSNYNNFISNKYIPGDNHLGYIISSNALRDNVLSPRYYNPDSNDLLSLLKLTHEIVKFSDLVKNRIVEVKTGHEAGKAAYGTGMIPFVRTSDISNWEIKLDPKHGLSEEIYKSFAKKQDIQEHDILMVKDGTYLIGTCALISKYDTKIVYQSHLYKIRVINTEYITPHLLLAILSSDIVQKQIKSKRFTQDIIDSLGSRINELELPIPRDKELKLKIESNVKKAVDDRIEARELARLACLQVTGLID